MPELPPRLKVLYPFEPKLYHADAGSMSYVDEGNGPAVVMIHGNPTWSFFYRDLILSMRADHRCLALDNLGCGLSDKPQKGPYTLQGHVDRAVAWLDSTGVDRFHLIVHDWGGPIGLGLADALSGKVAGITLMNTAAFPFPTIPARIAACRIPLVGALIVRGANMFVRGATKMTSVEPLSPAVAEGYGFPYGNWNDRVAVHEFVKDVPMRRSHKSWDTLSRIESSLEKWRSVPVQIVWGMQDWCFHDQILARWESILPDAKVHRFANAGHYLMEDAPDEIIPVVREFSASLSI